MGRKLRAESVKDHADEGDSRPERPSLASSEPKPGGSQVSGEARGVDEDLTKGLPRSLISRRERLPATEMEKRISRYSKFLDKLNVDEKRAVEEYFKRLRDL